MNPELYNALAKGDVAALLDHPFEPILYSETTCQKYTSLHVAVQYEKEECVEAILNSCPSSLLLNVNTNGDTALHIAARQGHRRIIERIIDKAKSLGEEDIENGGEESILRQLIKMANKNGDSALHEAVRNGRPKILVKKGRNGSTTAPSSPSVGTNDETVKYLLEAYPEFEYFENKAGGTPLYLAALYKLDTCVSQILDMCQTSAHSGPDGTTAMHAAVRSRSSGIINRLHEVKPSISKEADKLGWTPLHYAAYDDSTVECCESLIKTESTIAYILDKNGMSPLHVAAGRNNYKAVEMILKHCPDCWQVLDHRGQNYLHVAVSGHCKWMLESALEGDIATEESLNHPDIYGNTPLHLAAIHEAYDLVELLSKDNRVSDKYLNKENLTALDIILNKDFPEEIHLMRNWMGAREVLAKRCISPLHLKRETIGLPIYSDFDQRSKKWEQKMSQRLRNASNNHLVVAALIATVTFAAGFTIPDGFQSNNGQPILLEKAMFKVFAISNTIAMVLSTLAVLAHFLLNLDDDERAGFFIRRAGYCTIFAIYFMMLAFITGTYVELSPSLGLAIPTFVIGSIFYPLCYYVMPARQALNALKSILSTILSFLFSLHLFGKRLVPYNLEKYLYDKLV